MLKAQAANKRQCLPAGSDQQQEPAPALDALLQDASGEEQEQQENSRCGAVACAVWWLAAHPISPHFQTPTPTDLAPLQGCHRLCYVQQAAAAAARRGV
jgi:hypothetical protein